MSVIAPPRGRGTPMEKVPIPTWGCPCTYVPGHHRAMRIPWKGSQARLEAGATIFTSEKGWLTRLAGAYRNRQPVRLVDDAKVGIDPKSQNLVAMGLHAQLSATEWAAVGISLGLSAAGVGFVVLAFLDPEPTSKLGLLVGGGALCALTGGVSAVGILISRRPPNIQVDGNGFKITWG
jgi:hypothetical protein